MVSKLNPEERLKLIERVILGGEKVAEVCRQAGISRVLFYSWLKKYREAGQQVEALVPGRKKKVVSPKKVTPEEEKQILAIVKEHPQWSTKKISAALPKDSSGKPIIGNHGVQNVLQRLDLSTKEKRIAYVREISRPKERVITGVSLTPQQKLEMLERVIVGKEKVSKACQEYGISRTLFYRLKRRYEEAALEEKLRAVAPAVRHIERYWRQTPERYVQAVLDLVGKHPEYSVRKIVEHLPEVAGVPIVGHHGVQNILRRHSLSLYEQRLAYAQAQITPVTRVISTFEQAFARFFVFPVETRTAIVRFFSIVAATAFSTVVVLGSLGYFATVFRGVAPVYRPGLIFASIALSVGSIFFLYSMKYYFTLAVVLSFSRQPGEPAILGLNGRLNNNQRNGPSTGSGWLARIFGLNGSLRGPTRQFGGSGPPKVTAVGLEPNLESVKLEKHPFISIHLPFYNEKKVAERILSACTSFDYPNYEVVVCDDSTDETVEILEKWKSHPRIKIVHRETREGFKGGALREALRASDPRTEFIVVFDADFIPYPDTLELFLKYFKTYNDGSEDYTKSNIACVAGYQWHVLNKSENWITRGVRTEYSGSYVIERSGQEILGGMKLIHGSVYCIRADILKKFGWGTSITEDFELTLKLYEKGYKVVYTPYIQAPAECVSTIKRLIRQRMRWAEGHSHNIRKMFWRLLFGSFKSPLGGRTSKEVRPHQGTTSPGKVWVPSKLTFAEKLEFLYLSPYYLQACFFLVGTFSWLMAETVFRARLPFWTSLWGWSLVLTNFFSLPLMNAVGLFLEEGENKDYLGILSFIALSYLLVPFQAYASVKGFLEKQEGPWFRTPKTGLITDIFTRGRFYRWISGIIPGRKLAPVASISLQRSDLFKVFDRGRTSPGFLNPYLALATANNQFNEFNIKPKRLRWISKAVLVILLCLTVSLYTLAHNVSVVLAANPSGTFNIHTDADTVLTPVSHQLKDAAADVACDIGQSAKHAKQVGWIQIQPDVSNYGTLSTPCPAGATGTGWVYEAQTFDSTGYIGSGAWNFYLYTSDNTAGNIGYVRACVYRTEITGSAIGTSTLFFTATGSTDVWQGGASSPTITTGATPCSAIDPINNRCLFTNTEKYLYVDFYIDSDNGANSAPATISFGEEQCGTSPYVRIVTPGVQIPEIVLPLILVIPFLPMIVKKLKGNWAQAPP